ALRHHRAASDRRREQEEQDAGGDPHVDDVLGDGDVDVVRTDPETQWDTHLVRYVMEDVLGDSAFFLRVAAMSSWVLPRVVSSGRRFLFAERDAMLRRARTLALGHRRRLLFLYRTARARTVLRCLREEQRCDERERHRSGSRPPRPRRAE